MSDSDLLFDEMIEQQRSKVLAIARALNPRLTADDVMSPDDFPELADPKFAYEDGLLAGLISAQIALRALSREQDADLKV